MTQVVLRPCAAADLVDLVPAYKGSWGPALDYNPTPWYGPRKLEGFDFAATIRNDEDWNSFTLDPSSEVVLRFVLVPIANEWELRTGRTNEDAMLDHGLGTHRHMFSEQEAAAAENQGKCIKSGYIYGIESDQITIG
jgi:hypothetical protein